MKRIGLLPRPAYRRLSGQDASFLSFEGEGRPMHIGAVAWFESDNWRNATGGVDTSRLVETLSARAARIPALAWRLERAPVTGWPLWVESVGFDTSRCVEVMDPIGAEGELDAVAEAAMERHLDRDLPLWRVLIVPMVDGDRFALIFMAHHALVDGIAGIDMLALLLDGAHLNGPAPRRAQVMPTRRQLLMREALRWATLPIELVSRAAGILTEPRKARRALRRGGAFVRTCVRLLSPGPRTVLQGANNGQRQVAWFDIEERPLRFARKRLEGTPNDLVLAAVAQAMLGMGGHDGHFPFRRVRAAVPVSFRRRAERYEAGNRIGLMLAPLEGREPRLAERVRRINAHTALQKRRGDAEGYEVLGELTAWTGQWSQRLLHWMASTAHSYGILVTSVPGPSRPYTLGGAELNAVYPLVPLFGGQAISVAVLRYGGQYRVGVTSSWPDRQMAARFVSGLEAAMHELGRVVPQAQRESSPVPKRLPFPALD